MCLHIHKIGWDMAMTTTERIVESYYRLIKSCFTMADVKVKDGNNRQFDLLAYCLRDGKQYHVEITVMHGEWGNTLAQVTQFHRLNSRGGRAKAVLGQKS